MVNVPWLDQSMQTSFLPQLGSAEFSEARPSAGIGGFKPRLDLQRRFSSAGQALSAATTSGIW